MVIDLNTLLLLAVIAILGVLILKTRSAGVKRDMAPNDSKTGPVANAARTGMEQGQPETGLGTMPDSEAENDIALHEIFEVEEIPATRLNDYKRPQGVSPSSSYIQVVGELIKGTVRYRQIGQTFKICFKPEIEKGLRSGKFVLMNRGFGNQLTAVQSDHRNVIVGNGWIESARPDRLIAITSLAWQGMAFITAQKFLADINKSLDEIKLSIDELKEFQDAEIEGKVMGWQSYIKQAAERLAEDINITEKSTIAAQLEEIHRLSLEEYFAAEHRLTFHLTELMNLLNSKHANGNTAREVKTKCAAIEKEATRLLAFERINVTNMMALTMRLDFGGAEIVLRDNATLLEKSMSRAIEGLDAAIKKVKSLPAGFLRDTMLPILKYGVSGLFVGWDNLSKDWADSSRKMIGKDTKSLRARLRKQQEAQLQLVSRAQERLSKPPSLYFRVEADGQISQVVPTNESS